MVKKISRRFIKGVGSVMDIYPKKRYQVRSYVPGQSAYERLKGDWAMVGKAISKTITSHANGKR